MNAESPIGIFDSGLGGLSVAAKIAQMLPDETLLYFGDSARNPYGTKSTEEIQKYAMEIVSDFAKRDVKAVVIACNTATSAAALLLRKTFDFDIIGMEPALKVAARLKTPSRIAVWATDLTLREQKFSALKHRFEQDHDIISVPCPELVDVIEHGQAENEAACQAALQACLDRSGDKPLDAIVLGCTHFVYYKPLLEKMTGGKVEIVDGNEGTARHLKELLEQKNLLASSGPGSIGIDNSSEEKLELSRDFYRLLEEQIHE